ncbi:MAG: antibiotic biosynthesis monooxygenase [Clostridia bacterium]|nr:antibiotic biosynthesis monooxygenase [Clostridia bacterium]
MIATTVIVHVKPENVEDFKKITLYNAENARKEPGNVRFDVLWCNDDPTYFTLYEVYATEADAKAHKETAHYKLWRETCEAYMACPRKGIHHTPLAFD